MRYQKFILLFFVAASALIGLTLRSATEAMLTLVQYSNYLLLDLVPLSTLIGLVGCVLSFFILMRNTIAVGFTNEVIEELGEVTWPDRDETTRSTIIVVASSIFFASFLAFSDFIWAKVTDIFLFTG